MSTAWFEVDIVIPLEDFTPWGCHLLREVVVLGPYPLTSHVGKPPSLPPGNLPPMADMLGDMPGSPLMCHRVSFLWVCGFLHEQSPPLFSLATSLLWTWSSTFAHISYGPNGLPLTLTCAFLVLIMLLGFTLVEAGCVSKSAPAFLIFLISWAPYGWDYLVTLHWLHTGGVQMAHLQRPVCFSQNFVILLKKYQQGARNMRCCVLCCLICAFFFGSLAHK